jgi:hypothetical protein
MKFENDTVQEAFEKLPIEDQRWITLMAESCCFRCVVANNREKELHIEVGRGHSEHSEVQLFPKDEVELNDE